MLNSLQVATLASTHILGFYGNCPEQHLNTCNAKMHILSTHVYVCVQSISLYI